jgi:hypothetical protein
LGAVKNRERYLNHSSQKHLLALFSRLEIFLIGQDGEIFVSGRSVVSFTSGNSSGRS